jgi:colanic acid biosynthesis glycosyl transferase WcaI
VAVLVEDFQSPLVNRLLESINRLLLRRADRVIALGDTMKRRLVEGKGADVEKIAVIHNWADCDMLRPGTKPNAFSRANGLDGRFVVMHAGNIGLSQNLDIVLDAAAAVRAHDDIRFVMVGDGARRTALESQARARGLDNVMFLPYQRRDLMSESYATADVFLVSLKPGLAGFIVPSKLYSILAAGRPYIAAAEQDSEAVQITEQHGCGLVVPPGDGEALAARILDLHRDPALAAQLASRARQAALMFDRKRQVAAYADLLRSVAGRAGAAAA